MWSGTDGNIPSNWLLCNGSNGTPNLIDRFIVGGSAYAAGDTGGSADAIVPTHTHTATGGSHGHPVRHSTQIIGAAGVTHQVVTFLIIQVFKILLLTTLHQLLHLVTKLDRVEVLH